MYSDEELVSAVEAGIMTDEVAAAFRNHVALERVTPAVDEEHFRLITGFNDIFVVIACLLLLVSISWIGSSVTPMLGAGLQAMTAWGLSEYFTRKRLMSLPSIVLLLAFVGGVFTAAIISLKGLGLGEDITRGIPSAVAAFAAWLHWQRFKVPITVAAGTATLVAGVMFLLFGFVPEIRQWMIPITFVAGVLVFLFAMRWDSSDTQRQTGRSDVAFWLHLIAAPLIVHPIFSVLSVFDGQLGLWQAVAVTTLYIGIAIVSISIDRRALMVSALVYVLYAFNTLLEQYGVISLGFAFTAFSIGSGLLLLSAFWHTCRKAIIVHYPARIQNFLPSLR
ncbi:MAG: hypothetical protein GQ548_02925 [Methylophaga sp.]|nr:hypothetical protein [Methylophaga sp.]